MVCVLLVFLDECIWWISENDISTVYKKLSLKWDYCCSGCHRVIILTLSLWYQQAERVHELNEEIGKLLARAEQLGGEGNVEEAQEVLEKVEKTRAMKKEAEVSWQGVKDGCGHNQSSELEIVLWLNKDELVKKNVYMGICMYIQTCFSKAS